MFHGLWALALTLALQNAPNGAIPPTDSWTDDQPFARVLQNLGHDVQSMGNGETIFILAAGAAGAIALHPVDHEVASWVARTEYSSYTPVGHHLGDGWVQAGAAIGTYVVGRVSHDAKVTHIGSDLIRSHVLTGLITQGLKAGVGRIRPKGGSYSFPSGHSSAAFTSAAVLNGHFGWKVGVPAFAVSGFIGWSRFRDNSHWVSDVVFGSALGAAVGHAVISGHRPRSWMLVPAATKGGGAIFFVKRQRF